MNKRTDLVLSVSAMVAALSAIQQVAIESRGQRTIEVKSNESQHQDAIDSALSNIQTQFELRKRMGLVLPEIQFDPDSLEEAWVRLAHAQEIIKVASSDLDSPGMAFGLRNGMMDSTLREGTMGTTEIAPCYTNCHSACHGSRGWR